MEEKEIDKKEYELSFLSKTEEGAKEIVELVRSLGGEITFESSVNKIALAYKINKEAAAFFGWIFFTALPKDVKGIKDSLALKGDILRTLLITPPFVKGKPRPIGARPKPQKTSPEKPAQPLSNEALEKKIEEILNK